MNDLSRSPAPDPTAFDRRSNRTDVSESTILARDYWKGRHVFVTGATGFVGSWLVKELLAREAAVVALVRDAAPQSELARSGELRRISIVSGSLQDLDVLERVLVQHDIEVVFHLAAQTLVHVAQRLPLETFESNVRGSYNVLEACRRHGDRVRRVVVASSDKAYGNQHPLPYTEDMPLHGLGVYDVSKSCADQFASLYARAHGTPVAIARCGNIFGGGDLHWSRIVPGTIRALLRGERPVLRSDGHFVRDYLYVKDAVRAYLTLAERLDEDEVRGEGFNFSLEQPVTVLELVDAIQRHVGVQLSPVIQNDAHGEIRSQYLSCKKAKRVLDWRPEFDLDTGLRETVAWYRRLFTDTPAAAVAM